MANNQISKSVKNIARVNASRVSATSKFNSPTIDESNQAFVKHRMNAVRKIYELNFPGKTTDPIEVRERISKMFEICEQFNMTPLVEYINLCTGIPRTTMFDYMKGRFNSTDPQLIAVLSQAKDYIASCETTLAVSGAIDPKVYQFRSKNFFGMKDNTEVVLSAGSTVNVTPDNEKQLLDAIPDIKEIE